MKQFYWLIVGISLLSLASCKGKVKMARDCQTVKIDTVISADEQTYLALFAYPVAQTKFVS